MVTNHHYLNISINFPKNLCLCSCSRFWSSSNSPLSNHSPSHLSHLSSTIPSILMWCNSCPHFGQCIKWSSFCFSSSAILFFSFAVSIKSSSCCLNHLSSCSCFSTSDDIVFSPPFFPAVDEFPGLLPFLLLLVHPLGVLLPSWT